MGVRSWIWSTYIALSENKVLRSLRKTRFLGPVVRRVSRLYLPEDTLTWIEVRAGLGRGLKMQIDPRYDLYYWRGDYEEDTQAVFAKYLKPGAIAYDVGANTGFFSLIAARLVGPQGTVFAFEPDRENVSRLRRAIAANSLTQITVETSPVWSSNALVFFARPPDSNRFVGGVRRPGDGVDGSYEQAVTLDEFAESHLPPDFIKMDIEGGETEALAGAGAVFTEVRPVLYLEVHDRAAEQHVKEWLKQKAYDCEWWPRDPTGYPRHMLARPNATAG